MTNQIELTNSGPIEGTFRIDLSPGPGVYEFRGARGTGKTTAISSIDWLSGHRVDVTLHDAALSGKIEGFGVVAPIGGRRRRKGEFELDSLDAEKFSIADLVDPPGKTPEVRDAHCIKALAVLSEAKADPQLYYELAGGQQQFDALGVAPTDDPVLLATRIKQCYDKRAKEHENTAQAEAGHAAPLEHVPDDLDMSQECDLGILGDFRDAARDEHRRLAMEREAGIEKEQQIAAAASRLKEIQAQYSGPTVREAEKLREVAIQAGKEAKARLEELEAEVTRAKDAITVAKEKYVAANQVYEAANSHQAAADQLAQTAAQTVSYPEEKAVEAAKAAVEKATIAYTQGVRIRDVKLNQARAKGHWEAADIAEKQATAARDKASVVFDVLAQSLRTNHLKILTVDGAPRLFVEHPKRGRCAFDRVNGLSDGERVDYTLRELLPHIKTPGLLPIPQRVWQDLQPTDRKNLHSLAVEKGLFVFGAQVDDGPLRVVYLGDGGPGFENTEGDS